MPSPQRRRRDGRASPACPGVTPARAERRATAKVFDSRCLREERKRRALALRRSLVACAALAKKEDSASHARQPMRPCKRKATTRDGPALAPAQTKRTATHASPSCGITFDMSGIQRRTHCSQNSTRPPAVVCPLDGGVRPHLLHERPLAQNSNTQRPAVRYARLAFRHDAGPTAVRSHHLRSTSSPLHLLRTSLEAERLPLRSSERQLRRVRQDCCRPRLLLCRCEGLRCSQGSLWRNRCSVRPNVK